MKRLVESPSSDAIVDPPPETPVVPPTAAAPCLQSDDKTVAADEELSLRDAAPDSPPLLADSVNGTEVPHIDGNSPLLGDSVPTPAPTNSASDDRTRALAVCRQEAEERETRAARLADWRVDFSRRREAFDALWAAVYRLEQDCYDCRPAPFDPKEHPAQLTQRLAAFVRACPREELLASWQTVDQRASLRALTQMRNPAMTAADVEAVFSLACLIVDDCLAEQEILDGELKTVLQTGSAVNAPRWATLILGAVAKADAWPEWLVRSGHDDASRRDAIPDRHAEAIDISSLQQSFEDPGRPSGSSSGPSTATDEAPSESDAHAPPSAEGPIEETNIRCQDWAIGIEHERAAWLFRKFDGEWRQQRKIPVRRGRQHALLDALAKEGGFLTKKAASAPWHGSRIQIKSNWFHDVVVPEVSHLRRIMRRALRINKTQNPLPYDKAQKCWRSEIMIGYAVLEAGNYLGAAERLRFRSHEELQGQGSRNT